MRLFSPTEQPNINHCIICFCNITIILSSRLLITKIFSMYNISYLHILIFITVVPGTCFSAIRQRLMGLLLGLRVHLFLQPFWWTFYFPAQLVGGFTVSVFWTSCGHRCRPFFPPVRAFNFYRAQGSAFPLLVDLHRMLLTHALALSANQSNQLFYVRKSPSEYVHSVRIELAKLVLVSSSSEGGASQTLQLLPTQQPKRLVLLYCSRLTMYYSRQQQGNGAIIVALPCTRQYT